MKIAPIILYYLLIISCFSGSNYDNQKEIDLIDKMAISKTITEVEVDSLDQMIDTIKISKYKLDTNQKMRYEELTFFPPSQRIILKRYLKSNQDLFYLIRTNHKQEVLSIFETESNPQGLIEKAVQTSKERPEFDNALINYSYDFHPNGKIKEKAIETIYPNGGQMMTIAHYDLNEKMLNELIMMGKDTFSAQNWAYSNQNLVKNTYTSYGASPFQSISYYDANENIIKEEMFFRREHTFEKEMITQHIYNSSDERIKSIEEMIITGRKTYFKYMIN